MLKAALCGLGNIAWGFDGRKRSVEICLSHAGAYERHPDISLVAGYSPDPADRDAFRREYRIPVYESLDTLLQEEDPDIVSICSPSRFHYEQTLACLDHGVPMIWLEKPPAVTVAEMNALLARQATGKSTVLVNYQRRYLPAYQELRRCFLDKALGVCRRIDLTYSRGLETNGSHPLDLIFFMAGDTVAYRLEWVSTFGGEDNPSFAMTLADGTPVIVSGIPLPYHNIDVSLTCDGGRLSVLYGGMACRSEVMGEHSLFPGFYRLYPAETESQPMGGLAGGMENGLKDLLDAHEQKRQPVSSLRSARATMTLMQEVRKWQKRC